MVDFEKLRLDFPVLSSDDQKIIYFDNGASSLKPKSVIDSINYYYNKCPVNVHRGIHKLSMEASAVHEKCREKVANFINCDLKEVIFTANSTDSLNMIMYMLYNSNYFNKGDEIITTVYEHHANIVPWQFLAKKLDLKLVFVDIKDDFTLDLDDLRSKITNKTKLITVTHVSNTIATIAPIKEITKIAHEKDILIAVDGSQSVPHMKIDFKDLDVDFFAFTGHKMLGPTGIGCLIGKQNLLEKFEPVRYGGDMISNVTLEESKWNTLPYKFEAGTPNVAGCFGLSSAIDYLEDIGLDNVLKRDKELLKYAIEKLSSISNIEIYNSKDINKQGPILLFNLKGIDAIELSGLLDDHANIATRAGMHCAQPIVSRFNVKGLCRASFYFYNTFEEIDTLYNTLKQIDESINK